MANELQGGGSLPHRLALREAIKTIEASGEYICNNQPLATKNGKKNVRVAQSYLWSQIPLNSNVSSYVFNVIDQQYNVGTQGLLPMERRLKQQDVFFTYKLGFYLLCVSTAAETNYQFTLMTFPSANFYGNAPWGIPIANLMGLWTAGQLNVTVNGDVLTPAWDMGQHLVIPQTQVPPVGINGSPFFDQVNLNEDGYVVVEPNWIINGGNNNIYTVAYPNNYLNITTGSTGGIGNGFQLHLVLKWQGFLAQNVSSIMDAK